MKRKNIKEKELNSLGKEITFFFFGRYGKRLFIKVKKVKTINFKVFYCFFKESYFNELFYFDLDI